MKCVGSTACWAQIYYRFSKDKKRNNFFFENLLNLLLEPLVAPFSFRRISKDKNAWKIAHNRFLIADYYWFAAWM